MEAAIVRSAGVGRRLLLPADPRRLVSATAASTAAPTPTHAPTTTSSNPCAAVTPTAPAPAPTAPAAMRAGAATADDIVLVAPVPENRYEEVLSHVTPIFLRDEPLSRCFPPDASGARAADFRAYAAQQLRSGLCVAALSGGAVVAACLNRALPSAKVLGVDVHALGAEDDDPLNRNVLRLLTSVHQRLDLFGALGVAEVLEIGLISVEASHTGRGLGTQVVKASLALGAQRGLRAVKADCTGIASAKCCQKAGLVEIYSLAYDDYKPSGRVVFADTKPPNDALRVYAGRLHLDEPHVAPLSGFKL